MPETFSPIDIFVYGTLKKAYGNHALIRHCEFVWTDALRITGLTGSGFPVASFADQSDESFPYLEGEVWRIADAETLARVDRLEGHPDWYRRTEYVSREGRNVSAYHMADVGLIDGRFKKEDGNYEWNR